MHAGIATHYCNSSKVPEIIEALLKNKNSNEIESIINDLCSKPNTEFCLSKHIDRINKTFNASSIEEIVNNLREDNSEWARDTVEV